MSHTPQVTNTNHNCHIKANLRGHQMSCSECARVQCACRMLSGPVALCVGHVSVNLSVQSSIMEWMSLVAEKLNSSSSGEDTIRKQRSYTHTRGTCLPTHTRTHTHTHTTHTHTMQTAIDQHNMHDVAITCIPTYSDWLIFEFVGYTYINKIPCSDELHNGPCITSKDITCILAHWTCALHTRIHTCAKQTLCNKKSNKLYFLQTTCQPSGECRGTIYALLSLSTCHMHGYQLHPLMPQSQTSHQ